jgi:hypothetical protein
VVVVDLLKSIKLGSIPIRRTFFFVIFSSIPLRNSGEGII